MWDPTQDPTFATKLSSTLSGNNAVKESSPLERNNGHPGRTVHADSRRDCMLDGAAAQTCDNSSKKLPLPVR